MRYEIDKQMILESGKFGDSTSNMHYIPEYLNKGYHKIIDPIKQNLNKAHYIKPDHSHDGEISDGEGNTRNIHDLDQQ